MPETEPMQITIDPALKRRLAALARATNQDEGTLVTEAIANFLELQEWQRARIETALAAADRGEFASPEEVERVFNKYRPRTPFLDVFHTSRRFPSDL